MIICSPCDPPHHFNRLERILSDRGFTGQHYCIRAVKNCVGDIVDFRARRRWSVDHALQHLGRNNDGFAVIVAGGNNFFSVATEPEPGPSPLRDRHGRP